MQWTVATCAMRVRLAGLVLCGGATTRDTSKLTSRATIESVNCSGTVDNATTSGYDVAAAVEVSAPAWTYLLCE
ncbi:hypothetical protein PF002_g10840 [Phytophthora fragariae]|uniref:Secreted protein n=2 Tax=Phytophthora fragariae TaxID=53985 RepID=A0A6A3ZMQ2_9STRA|nr:hypothetical protein PF003_g8824 [Phytophthora fragariae]KAE9090661.1 hypothetical protein PF007_g19158 [Phytophthora fragariae]KAE9237802.1 hypothetical protein PF002_g10840 [Phytophthora fragariae]KAE9313489.1 hypothetical protein PF001_g8717 [Phytophthora fragariae]